MDLYLRRNGACEGKNAALILMDAQKEEDMWAEYGIANQWELCLISLHLHDPREINGGTWDRGKFGNDPIHVIE